MPSSSGRVANRNILLGGDDSTLAAHESKLRLSVFVSSLNSFCLGYNTGIIAGALIFIEGDPMFEPVSSLDSGMIVSCVLAGATLGAAGGSVADYIGRRSTQLAVASIFVLAPLGMAFAPNTWLLVVARSLSGVGVGVSSVLVNLYISEIAPAESRGRLGGWAPLMGTAGILVSYIVSAICSVLPGGAWRLQVGFATLPALTLLLLQRSIPETPRWLVVQERHEQALTSLRQLFPRASEEVVQAELQRIVADLSQSQVNEKVGICALCSHYTVPCILGVSINVLQQVSGINVVIYFGPKILDEAGFDTTESMIATAAVSAMQIVATLLLMRHIDRIGRRPLALLGIILMMFGLGLLIASFFGKAVSLGATGLASWTSWVAVSGMLVFRSAFSLSLGPLPYIMTSEFFPQKARAAGVALSWMSNWGSNFCVSLTFPIIVEAFGHLIGKQAGIAVIFSIYVVFCIVAYVFVLKLLPETMGLRLEAAAGGNADAQHQSTTDCPEVSDR